jgi:hypothetical protein
MENTSTEVTLQQSPLAYFDTMAGLAIGPFVSRITLGMQDMGAIKHVTPGLTLVMPTAALHQLGREIVKALENPEHRKALEDAFSKYQTDFPVQKSKAK